MGKTKVFLEMIKFEHTFFALPFAYTGYFLATNGVFDLYTFLVITFAMFFARTAGMCLNRLIDKSIDGKNLRTKSRALPAGLLTSRHVLIISILCLIAFIVCVLSLNETCVKFLPIALFLLVIYHYMKRFTWLCHFGIGAVLACAPLGGWLAASNKWEFEMLYVGLAVLFWVAGFDIIYSLQDEGFDRENKLHSIPSKFGSRSALFISSLCHFLTIIFIVALGYSRGLNIFYWIGVVICAAALGVEHYLIHKNRAKYLNTAFFTINSAFSIVFFAVALLGVY